MKKFMLSILLALVLTMSIMPGSVLANETDTDSSQTQDYGSFIDGGHVIAEMIKKNGKNAHPRIIMSEEKFANLREHIGDGSVTAILLEELRGEADRHVRTDPVITYETDDEDHLLETSKRVQRRVAALALAYNIFGDEKYARRAYEELEAACDFKDWSPKHFLDTAEMCTAFAYGYDWLYNWMTPEKREKIRTSLIEKGLNQVMEDYKDLPRERTYKWYQDKVGDNWQLVCTGGTNLAALAIGDEDEAKELAAQVLSYGYKRAYSFVRHAYSNPDGTYIEGLGYWDYATYYLGLQSSALIHAVGTDYGLADYEGIRKSADFVRYMSSNTSKSFSFGDDGESRDTGWAVFLWLGEHFASPELSAIRLRNIEADKEFRYLDVLWIDESKQSGSGNDNATDWGAVGACNASFRNTWDEDGLVAALHAGENNYKYHGHYDLGSFYIESNGSRFFTDLGNESYSLENRQFSYRIKAEGHNTLVINPTKDIDQREGANCLMTGFQSGNTAYAVTDLTDAYGSNGAEKVIRGLEMIKDRECIVVQDEISLNKPGEIYWFAHTKGTIDVASDGRSAIVTVGSDRLWVGLISEDGEFTVMKAEPLPTSLEVSGATINNEYRKLTIHLTNTKDTTISVACIPLKNGEMRPSWTPKMNTISQWSGDDTTHNPVTITKQPQSVTAAVGEMVRFDVEATGAASYKWQYSIDGGSSWNGCSGTGYNTANLSFKMAAKYNGRLYRCVVKNADGSINSTAVELNLKVVNKPVIITQPAAVNAKAGETVRFSIVATGATSYKWQYSADGGSSWNNCSGTGYNTASLSFSMMAKYADRQYRCVVKNGDGSVNSTAVKLTLKTANKPVIITQPTAVSVKAGETVRFSIVATDAVSYKWQYSIDGGSSWNNCSGTGYNTASLSFNMMAKYSGRLYRCVVKNGDGSVNSISVTLTLK